MSRGHCLFCCHKTREEIIKGVFGDLFSGFIESILSVLESRYGFTVRLTEEKSDTDGFSVGCGVRQVLEFERRVSVGEEQRTWALKAGFGEYSLLGIPGAEASLVLGVQQRRTEDSRL